jgi:hypothetical protein
MREMGHMAHVQEKRNQNRLLVGNTEGTDHGKDLGWEGMEWDKAAGCCAHGNKPSDSIKCEEFLDYLRNY